MSDQWRPFVLRRDVGGDLVRPIDGWQGALRFGPITYPYDIVDGTTLTGVPVGYDATFMLMQVPPTVSWKEAVLVRGGFGHPTTPLDGDAIWYEQSHDPSSTDQWNQYAKDQPVTQGRWYYYTLFLCVGTISDPSCEWLVAATAEVLVPRNYGHAEKLFFMIPPFYQALDDQQAANGRNGPLRKFSAVIGYDLDYDRTLLDGVLNVYDPDLAPLEFTQQVGANLGLPPEQALGGARYRALVGDLWGLDGERGSTLGLQDFVYAASNYRCDVRTGYNALLTPDDSEFVTGVGHWIPYNSSKVTDLHDRVNNVSPPVPTVTPTLVKYPGSTLLPQPGHGQGIMQVNAAATNIEINCRYVEASTDWQHYGIPIHMGEVWELQFYCCRDSGGPAAIVIGSLMLFDINGAYVGTTEGSIANVTDATAWTFYGFQYQHGAASVVRSGGAYVTPTHNGYVIPVIWWRSTTGNLANRYVCGVQYGQIISQGGAVTPLAPDIFLTLGTTKKLAGPQSTLGTGEQT